ncbi:MAG: class I SAM-dependent methyltransferase [Chloroflexi bacterium]|nr:class I SAM-dependent methyltransferase [Chloroflexota bacterium]
MTDLPAPDQISRALDRAGLRYVHALRPDLADQLSQWLIALRASTRNLTAIRDPEQAIERHVIEPLLGRHRLIAADMPVPHGPLIDVGSGNGAPGLPFALCEPQRAATLLDSRSGATAFLSAVVEQIGVSSITVINERAERTAHTELREHFALALSRATASPGVALELTIPFLRIGGVAMLWTGLQDADGVSGLTLAAERLGACSTPLDPPRDIQVFTKVEATNPGYPRPWNQIRRRPLTDADR